MKLIGYSRRKLDLESDLSTVFNTVEATFGPEGFRFVIEADRDVDESLAFNIELGFRKLRGSNIVGFFKENIVAVGIDNQAHGNGFFIYPHSTVQIETMEKGTPGLQVHDWLSFGEKLTTTLQLDLCFVLGKTENVADYYRTPIGVGIGLIKIFWIMCFGGSYSELIPQQTTSTAFFKRENFGRTCKAFVNAPSYEAYQSASPELLASQKAEIGDDLFNRLLPEKPGGGGVYWALNPNTIFRFVSFLYRQHATDWRKYQAKIVPDHYRK